MSIRRIWIYAIRVTKEIIRDPLSVGFGIGFPLVLLLLLSAIQRNIPPEAGEMFKVAQLTPGLAVFGLSFLALFSAQLISHDRAASTLQRMFTTPMRANEFILGYLLPLIPMALLQGIVCYAAALILGLEPTWNLLWAWLALLPVSGIYIGIGLLAGSTMSEKSATGLCGALLTNVSAWLSGTWFDLSLIGGWFEDLANLLPFAHAVTLGKNILAGNTEGLWIHFLWVCGYALVLLTVAILAFRKKMKA